MKSYCTAFALLGLAAPALAQSSTARPDPWLLPYPSGYVTGTATQACVGQFSDDLVADGALLSGGNVFLLYAPDRVCSYSRVTGPFASMAKVGVSGCSATEGLLVSSSAGLVLLQWNNLRELEATAVSNSSLWANAEELQVIPSSNGSEQWLCALSSARDAVLYARWDGAAMITGSAGAFDLGAPALTLAALDWDGDAYLDFAVDDGSGARVLEENGGELYAVENASSAAKLLRLNPGSAGDDLVWLTQNPYGSGQILTVIRSSDGSLEAPIYCPGTSVGRLTLADVDNDEQSDLVVTRTDDDSARVLFHQEFGDEMSFGLFSPVDGNPLELDLDPVYDPSNAVPAVAGGDLDGDGDEDLLFAGQPGCANTTLAWFAKGYDELGPRYPTYHPAVKAWLNDADYSDWAWPKDAPEGEEDLAHLSIVPWGRPSSGPASTASHIRVTVWARATETGNMDSECLVDAFCSATSPLSVVDIPLPPGLSPGDPLPQYLVVQLSYVKKTNGVITMALPAWTGQFDRSKGIPPVLPGAGSTTTGGVNQPPPPPSQPPPSP